jgi:hypothetical protein
VDRLNSIKFHASNGVSARIGNNYDGIGWHGSTAGRRTVMGIHEAGGNPPEYTALG